MYCVNCGVQLADTEKNCPLCGTLAYHPDLLREAGEPLYPLEQYPEPEMGKRTVQIVLTAVFLLPMVICVLCDLQINHRIFWSGYVVGGLVLMYTMVVLPTWFRKPQAVIFVPVSFCVLGLYLLYINFATGGDWFLSLAFPLVGIFGGLLTVLTALLRYVRRGRLYIFGGILIALGGAMPLVEFLISITFQRAAFIGWSWYPLAALAIVGGTLLFLAMVRPARETMERKFFI